MNARRRRAGFTLIELMVALVLTGIVLASIYQTLGNNQRFYRSTSQILDVQQGIRAVAQLLPSELREVDAVAGDILAKGPDSITIKALRNTYFICAPPILNGTKLIVRNNMVFGYQDVDPSRNKALVFREANPKLMNDDTWQEYTISSWQPNVGACTDLSVGSTLNLSATSLSGVALDSNYTVGSPVRTYEVVTYRLTTDADGVGWLGVRNLVNNSWSAVSPIAGPLRSNNGLELKYYDANGFETGTATQVAQIRLVVRGISAQPIAVPGRRASQQKYQDSLTVWVALRNNN